MIEKTELLEEHLREDDDSGLQEDFIASYSKLDIFDNCPYRYYLKYEKGLSSNTKTLALEIGSLCHKILELKAHMIMEGKPVDYNYLKEVFEKGYDEQNESSKEPVIVHIKGTTELKRTYGIEEWYSSEEGEKNYEEKARLFIDEVLPNEVPDGTQGDGWKVFASEMPINYFYNVTTDDGDKKRVRLVGFIDRVDKRTVEWEDALGEKHSLEEYRVVDYKTSRKIYDSKKLATPLQMVIYNMSVYLKWGVLPVKNIYSFILLNEKQDACTPGYIGRAIKKIDKLFIKIFDSKEADDWVSKGSPLCWWCDYREDGAIKDSLFKGECMKYCLWSPENKTFEINGEDFSRPQVISSTRNETGRKLIF